MRTTMCRRITRTGGQDTRLSRDRQVGRSGDAREGTPLPVADSTVTRTNWTAIGLSSGISEPLRAKRDANGPEQVWVAAHLAKRAAVQMPHDILRGLDEELPGTIGNISRV